MDLAERTMLAVYRLPLWVLVFVFVACFGGSFAWMYATLAPGSFWVVTACWFVGLPFYVCAMRKWRVGRRPS